MAGNPIYDAIEESRLARAVQHAAEDVSGWFHPHHDASQTPAATPVTVETTTAKENLMSLLDTIKNGVAEAESKLEGLDEEALATLKRVMGNPETAAVLHDLDGLAQVVGLPSGVVSGVASGLTTVLGLYAQQAPAPVPAQ